MQGKRRKGSQKKRRKDNIKEWTEMDYASSTWAAERATALFFFTFSRNTPN